MAPAADGDRHIGFARKPDSRDDINHIERSHDQLGVPFDHPVERGAGDVEATVVGSNDRSSMQLSQLGQRRHAATLRDLDELAADLGDRRTARKPKRQIEVGDEVLDHVAYA